jgi:hypothetical protein
LPRFLLGPEYFLALAVFALKPLPGQNIDRPADFRRISFQRRAKSRSLVLISS